MTNKKDEYLPEPIPEGAGMGASDALSDEVPSTTASVIWRIVENVREELRQIEQLLGGAAPGVETGVAAAMPRVEGGSARVIEGVFDGQNMIGADGKPYHVPPNYASKSKLVEGDMLKLAISESGSFVYKQIGPIERARVVGILEQDPATRHYVVSGGGKRWNVLTASVTFFKGEPGDEIVILIPKNTPSHWGAIENIIKQS